MSSAIGKSIAVGSMMVCLSLSAFAQTKVDIGKRQYDSSCAVCHGINGKGDGPYKPLLTKAPSDLSVLAKKNNGVLPVSRLYEVIDGRAQVAAHGPREMPIWGYGFHFNAAKPDGDALVGEEIIRARILSLIDYINRMQAK